MLLFVGCDDDDNPYLQSPSIIGTWNSDYSADGYYLLNGDCVPYIYNYDEFNYHGSYEVDGFRHIQFTEDQRKWRMLIEFPTIEESMCDENLHIGVEVSFTDGICKSDDIYLLDIDSITSNQVNMIFSNGLGYFNYELYESNTLNTFHVNDYSGYDENGNFYCFINDEIVSNEYDFVSCNNSGGIWAQRCYFESLSRIHNLEF